MLKPRMIEKIKSLVLVVLFLSTVLLLYFFWGNFSSLEFGKATAQPEAVVPVSRDLIKPKTFCVNLGEENYTVLSNENMNLWNNETDEDSFIEELDGFGKNGNILVQEITYAEFKEVFSYRSIYANFNYDISINDFCTNFKISKPQSYEVISAITTIGYSSASPKSFFIYDGEGEKYYRLVSEAENLKMSELIDLVETQSYNIYYPISSYLGVENSTLIPLAMPSNLKEFAYKQDTYPHQEDKINSMAETFFGKNFDFVRRITEDNGTVIYMYGYGQNVLIVNKDGSFEYKAELSENLKEQTSLEALETAVSFISAHGSWESLEGAAMSPYLIDIEEKSKEKAYTFTFGMEINGSRLYYKDSKPLVVEVTKGQVTLYKRNLIDFKENEVKELLNVEKKDAFSAVNLIAQNYNYIYEVIKKYDPINTLSDQEKIFNYVASSITGMDTGYLRNDQEEKQLKVMPVWIISIDNIQIYFDLYTAEPLGYSAI